MFAAMVRLMNAEGAAVERLNAENQRAMAQAGRRS